MKKFYFTSVVTLLMFLGSVYTLYAQAPEGFTYQAEARDSRGRLIVNTTLTIYASILEQSPTGNPVWEKTYTEKTDKYGLFSIIIGDVEYDDEDFASIEWWDGKYFLAVQVIYGTSTISMPVTQLLSVPYALYAKSAGKADIEETDPVFSAWDKSSGISISSAQVSDFDAEVANNPAVVANTAKNSYPEADATKLEGIAAGAEVNVNADWNASEGDAQIMNKPSFSNVATSGSYSDLSGTPDLSGFATKNMANGNITNLANPVNAEDAATKAYVDALKMQIKTLEDNLIAAGTYKLQDVEGNQYNVVKIGNQVWMAENLKTTKYNDGTAIPNVTANSDWAGLTDGAYCWYNYEPANGNTYGALYNWHSVSTGKLCPAGWHVPADAEWTTLVTFLGGETVAGGKMKETGTIHWHIPNTGADNLSGFSGLPGGDRNSNGEFWVMGYTGAWWSSTEYPTTDAWGWFLNCYYASVNRSAYNKCGGFSVRCVRDN